MTASSGPGDATDSPCGNAPSGELSLRALRRVAPVSDWRNRRSETGATLGPWLTRFVNSVVLLACLLGAGLRAAEVIPPRPTRYFNDYADIIPPAAAGQLNQQLEQFERDTSNQLLVAIYPRMQSDSSIEDYTVRVAQAWGVGQKDRNNGAVLFVFVENRQMFIQVGYGLEGVLPDGLCHLIVENELRPRFRQGDYAGGLQAGVGAMIAATRGEYHGTGRTLADRLSGSHGWGAAIAFLLLIAGFGYLNRYWRSAVYQSSGRRHGYSSGPTFWLGGGGGFGGGGFGGGGGGGFSGGGGGFGGGGAGGGW
jgi:uncharacterized protein